MTTLTKRLSEELSRYLFEMGVKAKYLHSDIDTVERMQIIRDLRLGKFDVLVGINLLREGLDIPEVSLVAILDADKQGFLRSETALIQTCGRAARNAEGRVIMYADKVTPQIANTLKITDERRRKQEAHNTRHGITPRTVIREITALVQEEESDLVYAPGRKRKKGRKVAEEKEAYLTPQELEKKMTEAEQLMNEAAKELRFEDAAHHRDQLRKLQRLALS